MFKVIGTETYLKEINKFSGKDKLEADKIPISLSKNPYTGKILSYPFLREKKISGKRIYFLIYDDLKLVLLVATSEKKDQQETIDHIKHNLSEFKKIAEIISKQVS